MIKKLTNVTFENHYDTEWVIKFHFEESYEEIWVHKDMSPKGIIQQIMGTLIQRLIQNYIS